MIVNLIETKISPNTSQKSVLGDLWLMGERITSTTSCLFVNLSAMGGGLIGVRILLIV